MFGVRVGLRTVSTFPFSSSSLFFRSSSSPLSPLKWSSQHSRQNGHRISRYNFSSLTSRLSSTLSPQHAILFPHYSLDISPFRLNNELRFYSSQPASQPESSSETPSSSSSPPPPPPSSSSSPSPSPSSNPSRNDGDSNNSRILRAFAVFVLTGSVLFSVYMYQKSQSDVKVVKAVRTVGSPAIGGPFSLFDTQAKLRTEQDYPGYRLMYFGFTFCPDICPTELTKMAEALNIVEKEKDLAAEIFPIFVSVDPWRDSIAQVREYVKEFHPKLQGLTGTPQEIEKVCKRFRIYYSKPPAKVRDGIIQDEFYLMDHSAYMYLMDPNNKCVDYFSQAEPAETIAERIIAHVGKKSSRLF